ncbi:MAG: amino acid permease [Halobacteriaceae archaeon]
MAKTLERDLGLYATFTISIGAMVGSGIFVLPGLAAEMAGPAVILAYPLAGLVVLPAALSKAEMATAMPESGGTYLFIDRAMGPLPGTVAGLGAWFTLVFKSAFALVGLGAYLVVLAAVPKTVVALVLGVGLVGVNLLGVRQSGWLQSLVVSVVLAALVGFVAVGAINVTRANFHPFYPGGGAGILSAAAFVFVSYAGVTKVASVAEEVEDPGRTIPLAIVGSITLMIAVYTLVVYVAVGVLPGTELAASLAPMAVAAGRFLGSGGQTVVAVVAVLALVSMANAGILAASRYPLAMSRDGLAPRSFSVVSDRFRTPSYAIGVTGVVLVVLIAGVPVVSLAKLASAFQLLVFVFVNAALVAFRESGLPSYDPEWVAPGYPWVQLVGIGGGLVLLTQMGWLPFVGAVGIVVVGVVWYRVYGRERTDREGAAVDAIRRTTDEYAVEGVREAFAGDGIAHVVIVVAPETPTADAVGLLSVGSDLVVGTGGRVEVVQFEAVPDQVTLERATERTATDELFERETAALAQQLGVTVETASVVTHDVRHGVVNYAREAGAAVVLGAWQPDAFGGELLGRDDDWYIRHSGTDLVFGRLRELDGIETVAVASAGGPFDPFAVQVAHAVAQANGARLRFVQAVDADATEDRVGTIAAYHESLTAAVPGPVESEILPADDAGAALVAAVQDADLVVASTAAHHWLYDVAFGAVPDRLASDADATVLLTHAQVPRRHTFLRQLLDRYVF